MIWSISSRLAEARLIQAATNNSSLPQLYHHRLKLQLKIRLKTSKINNKFCRIRVSYLRMMRVHSKISTCKMAMNHQFLFATNVLRSKYVHLPKGLWNHQIKLTTSLEHPNAQQNQPNSWNSYQKLAVYKRFSMNTNNKRPRNLSIHPSKFSARLNQLIQLYLLYRCN